MNIEVKNDTTNSFAEVSDISNHSSSRSTILSFNSVLENFRLQTEMVENLLNLDKKLFQIEQMENEFINTAGH